MPDLAINRDLDRAAAYAARAGRFLAAVALTALSIYAGCKLVRWYRFTRECRIVRITLADPMIGHPAINPYSTVEGLYHEH